MSDNETKVCPNCGANMVPITRGEEEWYGCQHWTVEVKKWYCKECQCELPREKVWHGGLISDER